MLDEPIGGDDSGIECSKCESTDTIFVEYSNSSELQGMQDVSELGIKCQNCDHDEEPDEYAERFKTDNSDY